MIDIQNVSSVLYIFLWHSLGLNKDYKYCSDLALHVVWRLDHKIAMQENLLCHMTFLQLCVSHFWCLENYTHSRSTSFCWLVLYHFPIRNTIFKLWVWEMFLVFTSKACAFFQFLGVSCHMFFIIFRTLKLQIFHSHVDKTFLCRVRTMNNLLAMS